MFAPARLLTLTALLAVGGALLPAAPARSNSASVELLTKLKPARRKAGKKKRTIPEGQYQINDRRQVTGNEFPPGGLRAFVIENGVKTYLPSLTGYSDYTSAADLNNLGQVVGGSGTGEYGENGELIHAVLWENGQVRDLGTLGGPTSHAYGINDHGQIVGAADTAEIDADGYHARHAFLWQNGVMTDLGTLGGTWASGEDINEQGQVVGASSTTQLDRKGASLERAFFWQAGTMTDLGGLTASDDSFGNALSNTGFIAGQAETGVQEGDVDIRHAVLWRNGQVTDLAPAHHHSRVNDVNDAGQVVGYISDDPSFVYNTAVLWQNGVQIDLNAYRPARFRWYLTSAIGVNDQGQIACLAKRGSQSALFLLTLP